MLGPCLCTTNPASLHCLEPDNQRQQTQKARKMDSSPSIESPYRERLNNILFYLKRRRCQRPGSSIDFLVINDMEYGQQRQRFDAKDIVRVYISSRSVLV